MHATPPQTSLPILLAAQLTAGALAPACGGATDDNRTSGAELVSCDGDTLVSRFIDVTDNSFSPAEFSIPRGEAVEFASAARSLHTVTSGAPDTPSAGELFDSGNLRQADSVCLKFTETGSFDYHCRYHADSGMTGVVTVEAPEN